MCLYPKKILNRRYLNTMRNKAKGFIPHCDDERMKYVEIPCGVCIECMKKRRREWVFRLEKEYLNDNKCIFVTLTFSDESIEYLSNKYKIDKQNVNVIAKKAVRLFLERYRWKNKVSCKHWLTTELGDTNRIHLHGLIWGMDGQELKQLWKYGFVYVGKYVNNKTINYMTKYMLKSTKGYKPVLMVSPGIGKCYTDKLVFNKYIGEDTTTAVRLSNGQQMVMPTYYKNKIYSEEERIKLWGHMLDRGVKYVLGNEYPIDANLNEILHKARLYNRQLGYFDGDNKGFKSLIINNTTQSLNKVKLRNAVLNNDKAYIEAKYQEYLNSLKYIK